VKARKKYLYFQKCRLRPAPSENRKEPKGDPQRPEWDDCLHYLEAACAWSERDMKGLDVRINLQSATFLTVLQAAALEHSGRKFKIDLLELPLTVVSLKQTGKKTCCMSKAALSSARLGVE